MTIRLETEKCYNVALALKFRNQECLHYVAPEHAKICAQNPDFRKDLVRMFIYAAPGYKPLSQNVMPNIMAGYFGKEYAATESFLYIKKEDDSYSQVNAAMPVIVFNEDTMRHMYNTIGLQDDDCLESLFFAPSTNGPLATHDMYNYSNQQKEICSLSESILWPFLESRPYGGKIIPQLETSKKSGLIAQWQ